MDARIILAGQQPDIVNVLARSNEAAQQRINYDQQNALSRTIQQNGPGIMAGDPNALNALARFDPQAALGVQSTRLGMDATRQQMSILGENEKREVEKYARELGKEKAAEEALKIENSVKQALAAPSPEAFDAMVQQMGRPDLVGQYENRNQLAARHMSVAEVMKMTAGPESEIKVPEGLMFADPRKPRDGFVPVPGAATAQEWRAATPQEAAQFGAQAGQINTKTGKFDAQSVPKGTSLTVDPTTGAVTFREGANVNGTGEPTVGDVYNPNEIKGVVQMIDDIAADPSLPRVVGPIMGGGGNDIDQLNVIQRGYYGGQGTALVERIGQLQSNAWLSARAMLKGGGAITDYESKKAEAAVARLSRAKSEAEFRTGLKDLRDAITEGEAKLRGKGTAANPPAPPAPITTPGGTVLKFDAEGNRLP